MTDTFNIIDQPSNVDLSLVPPGTFTTSHPTIDPIVNENRKTLAIAVNVTAITGAAGFTLAILGRNIAAGDDYRLLTMEVDLVGEWVGFVGAGVETIAETNVPNSNTWIVAQGLPLPRIVTVTITRYDNDSITYSVGASLMR